MQKEEFYKEWKTIVEYSNTNQLIDYLWKLLEDTKEVKPDTNTIECPTCNGDGVYTDYDENKDLQTTNCNRCGGTGKVKVNKPDINTEKDVNVELNEKEIVFIENLMKVNRDNRDTENYTEPKGLAKKIHRLREKYIRMFYGTVVPQKIINETVNHPVIGVIPVEKVDTNTIEKYKISMSEQQGKPYIVIDDMTQGGKTVFAGRLEHITKNNLFPKTDIEGIKGMDKIQEVFTKAFEVDTDIEDWKENFYNNFTQLSSGIQPASMDKDYDFRTFSARPNEVRRFIQSLLEQSQFTKEELEMIKHYFEVAEGSLGFDKL